MTMKPQIFDKFPSLIPAIFEEDLLSSSFFSEFEKCFNSSRFKQSMVYPVDVYNILDEDKPIMTVIEIACAGMKKDKISVNVNGNKLYVDIGYELDKSSENNETVEEQTENREYIQKTIAGRCAKMSWTLRNNIDKSNIKVSYTDGILKIALPLIQLNDEQISFEIE